MGNIKKNSPSGISQHLATTSVRGKTYLSSLKSDKRIIPSSDEDKGY